MLIKEILTVVKFTKRKGALHNKTKQKKEIFCYYLQSGHIESQKDSHETLAHHKTATYCKLKQIFNQPPIVSYRKEKSLENSFNPATITKSTKLLKTN